MKENIVETFTLRGYTVKIVPDEDATSPRKDMSNVGTMVCWHNRYDLGDETRTDDPGEWLDSLAEEVRPGIIERLDNQLYSKMVTAGPLATKDDAAAYKLQTKAYREARSTRIAAIIDQYYIMRPLGLLDHSGLHMWIGSGPHWTDAAGWDSGQVGWIYCTKKKAVDEWGKKRCTKRVIDLAVQCLTGEVETYDQYLTGDVYGFIIENSDGDEVDSCWGHFGLKWAIESATDNVPNEPCLQGGEGADQAMEDTLP